MVAALSQEASRRHQYFIPRDVSICRTEDGVVFLDLATQNYIGLGNANATALERLVADWPTAPRDIGLPPALPHVAEGDHEHIAKELVSRKLLTRDPQQAACRSDIVFSLAGEITLEERIERGLPLRPDYLWNFFVAIASAACRLRFGSFARLVDHLGSRKAGRSAKSKGRENVRNLATTFLALQSFFLTRKGACLFDSIALAEFLASYGAYPTVVLAVRTSPFAAHCWVQHEGLVLNDSVANVREFFPILAI